MELLDSQKKSQVKEFPYFRDFKNEFWENDGEIRIKRTKGVDGVDVSYPGAEGDEGRAKRCISARSELERGRRCTAEGSRLHLQQKKTKHDF